LDSYQLHISLQRFAQTLLPLSRKQNSLNLGFRAQIPGARS